MQKPLEKQRLLKIEGDKTTGVLTPKIVSPNLGTKLAGVTAYRLGRLPAACSHRYNLTSFTKLRATNAGINEAGGPRKPAAT